MVQLNFQMSELNKEEMRMNMANDGKHVPHQENMRGVIVLTGLCRTSSVCVWFFLLFVLLFNMELD